MGTKTTLITLLLLAVNLLCPAQEKVNLGYCSGNVATSGALTVDGKTWVSGAIYLPQSYLAQYSGAQITTVRAGLATKLNVDSLRVWVRESLDGDNLADSVITLRSEQKIKRGWNDVVLPHTVTIPADKGLYIGYSYHQKTATGALSVVGSPLDNAFYAQLGTGTAWQDMSANGILSVEAIAEGVSKPDYDLALTSAKAAPTDDANVYEITATVANNGSKAVSGFTLTATYANEQTQSGEHWKMTIEPGEQMTIEFNIPSKDIATAGDIIVNISSIDDGTDAIAENNSVQAIFGYLRNVFIEEYTTERCSNCPRVAGYLHEVMNMDKYKGRIISVCHHAGFYTDWLTQPCDNDLISFFGIDYAPAMAFDRSDLGNGQVHICPTLQQISSIVDERLEAEPHATVSINPIYDASTRELKFTVSGERNTVFTKNPTQLLVYVVENNVKGRNQAGADDPTNYIQQHVIRLYNDTWGDAINWNVNKFSHDYTFTLDADWKVGDMQIIAAIGSYNSSDNTDCQIENACAVAIPTSTSISSVVTDNAVAKKEFYRLDGTRLNSEPAISGIYIEVNHMQNGTITTRKVIKK